MKVKKKTQQRREGGSSSKKGNGLRYMLAMQVYHVLMTVSFNSIQEDRMNARNLDRQVSGEGRCTMTTSKGL